MLGCAFATGRIVGLANPPFDSWFPPPSVSVSGPYVAFGESEIGSDGFAFDAIFTKNILRPEAGRTIELVVGEIGAVRVKADGAVAWIACDASTADSTRPGPQCMHPGRSQNALMKLDAAAGKPVTVALGRSIDPTSLRLAGSTLTWREDDQRHTAKLS